MIWPPCAGWRQWIWMSLCLSNGDLPWCVALADGNFLNQIYPRPCSPVLFPCWAWAGPCSMPGSWAHPCLMWTQSMGCFDLAHSQHLQVWLVPAPLAILAQHSPWAGGIRQQRQVWMCLCLLGTGCVQAGLQPAAGSLLLTQRLCEPPESPSLEEVPWPHSGTGRCRHWDWSHGPFLFFFSTA